jgi:hypothetical protein
MKAIFFAKLSHAIDLEDFGEGRRQVYTALWVDALLRVILITWQTCWYAAFWGCVGSGAGAPRPSGTPKKQ